MAAPALQGDLNESHLRSRPGAQPMWGRAVPQGRRLLAAPKEEGTETAAPMGPPPLKRPKKAPPKPVLLQPCQSLLQQHRGKRASLWPLPAATKQQPHLGCHFCSSTSHKTQTYNRPSTAGASLAPTGSRAAAPRALLTPSLAAAMLAAAMLVPPDGQLHPAPKAPAALARHVQGMGRHPRVGPTAGSSTSYRFKS